MICCPKGSLTLVELKNNPNCMAMNNQALKSMIRTLVLSTVLHIAPIPVLCSAGPWELGDSYREGNTIHYDWTYWFDGEHIPLTLELDFTRGWSTMQSTYKTKGHSHTDYYSNFVKRDPYRADMDVVAKVIRQQARAHDLDAAKVALSFVQSIPHDDDNPNYQRFGVETLIDRVGDCSDKSVLLMALLAELGYECIGLLSPGHMQVGIKEKSGGATFTGEYWNYNGFRFYTAETNAGSYPIGHRWPKITHATFVRGYIREGSIQGVEYYTPCSVCDGTGWKRIGHGENADTMPCSRCGGRGWY